MREEPELFLIRWMREYPNRMFAGLLVAMVLTLAFGVWNALQLVEKLSELL